MSRGLVVITTAVLSLVVAASLSIAEDVKAWDKPGAKAGEEIVGPDGGKMVWVPAGDFNMGDNDLGWKVHKVHISKGFWLGKCTVTNAQYQQFCQTTGAKFPAWSEQGDNHPVVEVTWTEAEAYCKHYGLSLPTEAQWEYAARGAEGRVYPWGKDWDPKKCCNFGNQGPGGRTFPVGSFPAGASWCGALDMAGNVWQCCQDWFADKYYASSPDTDPPGPDNGKERVSRGGSWLNVGSEFFACACRDHIDPKDRSYGVGFRCVRAF